MTNSPPPQSIAINRALIGIIAAVLLGGAAVLWFFAGGQNMWTGACLKVGTVMSALWLALPSISRHGNWGRVSWLSVIGFMAMILVMTGKRVDFRIVLAIMFGVAVTVMILRPKSKSRSK